MLQASINQNKSTFRPSTQSQSTVILIQENELTSHVNMSSTQNTTGTSNASPAVPPRLKNSCDMCSVSKVRCESQKPVCSRCTKLGHPCSYSIARRVGRRHGSRRIQEHPAEPPVRQVPGAIPERQAQDSRSYGRSTAQSCSLPSLVPLRPSTAGPPGTEDDALPSSSHGRKKTGPRPIDDVRQGFQDILMSSPPLLSPGQSVQPQYCQATSSSVTSNGRPSGGSITSFSNEASSLAALDESIDCMGVAMALQEQLEDGSTRLCSSSPSMLGGGGRRFPMEFMRSVDGALETLSSACNRLSTVLICTCSERLEVGLLVATVCISMLDMYGAIVRYSATSSQELTGTSAGENDAFQQWNLLDLTTNSHKRRASLMELDRGPPAEESPILDRVFEELPKVGSLVLQFSKRYRAVNAPDGAMTGSTELLYALASYARVRLQNVKNEATGQHQYTV